MDRASVPQHPMDPRLVKKEATSQVGISTPPMTSIKDPRGPRHDPDAVRSDAHGNGNSARVADTSSGEQSMGDKAKREEGYEASDPQSRDHKPSAYQVARDSDVNAPVGEQRTAPNLLPQQASFPQVQQPGRVNKQEPPVANIAPSLNSAAGMPTAHQSTGGSKIFVGGLSWETDEGSLRRYFESFGEVLDCVIMRDRHTGHPRGFGFVTFADDAVAERAAARRHDLDGRQVEAKRAVPRNEFPITGGGAAAQQQAGAAGVGGPAYGVRPAGAAAQDPRYAAQAGYAMSSTAMRNHHTTRGKVFVGGLPSSCGNEEFKAYFQTYGEVVDAQVMIDHNTGNSRGFGFVTFANEATVETVVGPGRSNTRHEIMGKNVEVKRAEPKGMSTSSRRHDAYGSGSGGAGMRGAGTGGNSNLGGGPDAGSNAAAAAAYYGNYATATASIAEQYGAYYNNPQWQQYYAAMGYNFNAYPQGYNPYNYLSAYVQTVANGSSDGAAGAGGGMGANNAAAAVAAAAAGTTGMAGASGDVQGTGYDAGRSGGARYGGERDGGGNVSGGNGAGGGPGGSSGSGGARRSSRRDDRYHPYR